MNWQKCRYLMVLYFLISLDANVTVKFCTYITPNVGNVLRSFSKNTISLHALESRAKHFPSQQILLCKVFTNIIACIHVGPKVLVAHEVLRGVNVILKQLAWE